MVIIVALLAPCRRLRFGTVPTVWSEHEQRGTGVDRKDSLFEASPQPFQPVPAPKAGCRQIGKALAKVAGGPRIATNSKRTAIRKTAQQQEAWSEDGNFRCIALGCMRDPRKTHYQRHASNKYPEWKSGFAVWMDGEYVSVSKYGTNWEALLGPELYAQESSSQNRSGLVRTS
jgi:hypothetical protein